MTGNIPTTMPQRMGYLRILWVLVSVFPLIAYASPLWNNLLADTPIADLIWIPFLALAWSLWNLMSDDFNRPDDNELNVILGLVLAVITGLTLILAPERWPAFFVYDHGGLLLWPVWILAMSWLFWGLQSTRLMLAPLAYLLLVWPPIFEAFTNATQAILVKWAIGMLNLFSRSVSWLHPAQAAGIFTVGYHGNPVLVVVAQACSGADSLLAAAIMIPIIGFLFTGRLLSKILLNGVALIGALVLNWLRLAAIVFAVHIIGPHITFTDIHPVLGFVLFAILASVLLFLVKPLGLRIPPLQSSRTLRPPGAGRIGISAVLSVAVFVLLLPLFSLPQGSFGNPRPVSQYRVRTFLPKLPQFAQTAVYYGSESSVLGAGSATQADLYVSPSSSGQALLEMWSTPSANALATYGFHACLLYHGDTLSAVRSFQLIPGVVATAYAVQLPPGHVGGHRSTYVDIEWSDAITIHGHVHYMRWSLAAFPASRPNIPQLTSTHSPWMSLSPMQAMVAPASRGQWTGAIRTTRSVLIELAQEIFQRSLNPAKHA